MFVKSAPDKLFNPFTLFKKTDIDFYEDGHHFQDGCHGVTFCVGITAQLLLVEHVTVRTVAVVAF